MASLPNSLKKVALFFERLPGIGAKTANRLAFYLLRLPDTDLKDFGDTIISLKQKTKLCKVCLNLTEEETCSICQDVRRDRGIITVVESVLDILSFETGGIYDGVYHVLHGKIDPLNNISAEDIYINRLVERIKENGKEIKELILATNPDMEGEATAMYLRNKLQELREGKKLQYKITRLGYGLPIGAHLEYADYMTLKKAIENRNEY